MVHRAEHATVLADGLAELLRSPLPDPLAPELVAVPAKGVERWLAQRLSHRLGATSGAGDGVCANVDFTSPQRLLAAALSAAAPEQAEHLEAWTPERLAWPLLAAIDDSITEPWARVLRRHLYLDGHPTPDASSGRRLSLATSVARLFQSYARNRPDLLRRWAEGHAVLPDGTPLALDEQWQPLLWNRVRDELGSSPVDLQSQLCRAVRERAGDLEVPERVSVFGTSRLSRVDLDLVAALATGRDVHLWVHHASPALWQAVQDAPPVRRRADDPVGAALRNPLLGSLSRDVRELQHLLRARCPDHVDVHHPSAPAAPTLLGRLREDLAHDRVPEDPPPLAHGDRSVQVHACHGRTRQVEVLRDVVLGLLCDDATLQPRDVLVMCPDVETFAPLLAAAFATRGDDVAHGEGAHPAARVRVRVADRALHQANPLLAVLDRLLDLGTARLSATEVLDLAGHPAVARRFGFDDDDLERLRAWTAASGTRWGLHEQHRAEWSLQNVPDGTWRRGLDRVLLGAAVDPGQGMEAATLGGLVPLDDVDSSDIDLAGRFAELLDRLGTAHADMARPHGAPAWADLLEGHVLRLAESERDAAWQHLQLRDVLAEALVQPTPDAPATDHVTLALVELRPVLRDALAGRPTKAGFRTGAMTVCTMVPMRSVPHRVVVLLGLDDGAFPRQTVRDGDDLLARDPEVGDRDPRSEDRQLLLDAVFSAGQHLVITYTGADERTGAPVPPAVPLGELLDALDRTVTAPGGGRVREVVTTHHPLQPFDERCFDPGALGRPGPFSFDPGAHRGAVAAVGGRRRPDPLFARPLPPAPAADVALEDLVRMLVHPAKAYLRQRLQISLAERDGDPDDALAVELDALQQWGVGTRMLADRLTGLDPQQVMTLERGRAVLPPGPLGGSVLRTVGPRVESLAAAARPFLEVEPDALDVSVELGDGTWLSGSAGGVRADTLVSVVYSSLGPKHRLSAWVTLLAVSASHPGTAWRAVTMGRGTGRDKDACATSTLGPVAGEQALNLLQQLVTIYRAGLDRPLPLPLKAAEAYAAQRARGRRPSSARVAAATMWDDGRFDGECSDPEHALLLGPAAGLDRLLAEPALPGDLFNGWPSDEEGDRFGVLARRVWEPLLAHEVTAVAG